MNRTDLPPIDTKKLRAWLKRLPSWRERRLYFIAKKTRKP